jgi:AcrR family transcriptional regulator
MKTREKILFTARGLFNEFGVPNVTLRRIAATMNISQGNLNYHFKKREDIIEALYYQLMEVFNEEKGRLNKKYISFDFILDSTRKGMSALYEYRFLMIDFNQNMRENPKIHEQFILLEQIRKETYLYAFKLAIEAGVMRSPLFEGEYEGLNERIQVFSDFWIASSDIYKEPKKEVVDKYHNLLVEMFFPYFTINAQQQFLQRRKNNSTE